MPDTGFKAPTTTGEFLNAWTTPSNAFSSDNAFSEDSCQVNIQQDYATFGFVIPGGSTIDGIEVTVEGRRGATACLLDLGEEPSVALSFNDGTTYTADKTYAQFTLLTDETRTLGGSTDTWGRTWTVAEFSDANFKLRVTSGNPARNQRLDQFLVKVYYTEAPRSKRRSRMLQLLRLP